MISRYAWAVAAAPLLVATSAQAQVVISNTRTTPISTSNATGNGPADIVLTEDGTIEVRNGTAITGDSSNQITLEEGADVEMEEAADGATGILLRGGSQGSLNLAGAISITDSQDDSEDEDDDGDADTPFATGRDRYGVRIVGDEPRTGDLFVADTGRLAIEGNSSTGLSLETDLIGRIDLFGSVSVTGDNGWGVRLVGDVSDDVLLSGSSVSATGENSVGISVEGDIGGRLQIQSTVRTSGYRYTSAPTSLADLDEDERNDIDLSDDDLYLEDLDADDLLQNGSALVIAGNVAGGLYLGATPTYEAGGEDDDDADRDGVEDGEEDDDGDGIINEDDDDLDGDGILDEDEGTASIATYGGAPALVIGSQTSDVTIGRVGVGDDAYGLINEGSIAAFGVYDGVDAYALQVGVAGGRAVLIDGGIRNDNTISASSAEASSTGLMVGAGATVPRLANDGSITATATSEGLDQAIAVLIESGGSLTFLVNTGTIGGAVYGEEGDAIGVRDLSGQLVSIENTGTIYGGLIATDDLNDTDDDNDDADDEETSGRSIALDLSANTTGVTLVQRGQSDQRLLDSDSDDVFDDEDDDDDNDGIPDDLDDEDNDVDNDGVYNTDESLISGDILLGSGADVLDIQNGSVLGDLSFGGGQDRFIMRGTAIYQGAISDADGRLDVVVNNATLDARQLTPTAVSSLSIESGGSLIVTVDPQSGSSGGFNVSGSASFADDSSIGLRLTSLVRETQRYTIVTAGTLSYAEVNGRLSEETAPYLVVADFSIDRTANAVNVDVRRRTPAEMALSVGETAAYDAFYDALERDEEVRDAFLAPESREDFINLYEQTLPDHSGGTLLSLSGGVDAVTRALAGRNTALAPGEVSGWVQELNFYADKDRTETYGFRAEGFGVAGGYEKMTPQGVIGASLALTSSDIEDPESEAEEVLSANLLELGLYWRAQGRGWAAWGRAAAGYASFSSVRTLVDENIRIETEADWNGLSVAAAVGVSYERRFDRITLRPEAYAEIFSLREGSRTEDGGGDSFDLEIEARDGMIANASAILNVGYSFGDSDWLRPEVRLGWKQTLAYDAGETIARYVSGGDQFVLGSDAVSGGGPVLGFGLNVGNDLGSLSIVGDAQLLEDYVRYSLLLRASFRF